MTTPAQKAQQLTNQVRALQSDKDREQASIEMGNRVYARRTQDVAAVRAKPEADADAGSIFANRREQAHQAASEFRHG